MAYKALYFDEVRQDIKEAKEWYRLQRNGLEKRFSLDLKTTIRQILDRPSVYAIRYKNIRIAHPDIFPYSIHFYIDDLANAVVITAIVHNSRNPAIPRARH